MVDVGYFINGRHGVIKNVKLNRMDRGIDAVWCEGKQEELYRLKFENIEYIIPSDIECVSGKIVFDKDGVGKYVENKNLLPPKPITIAEKFKEVFGYEPNRDIHLCDIMDCTSHCHCGSCEYCDDNWDVPYVKAEVKDDKC